MLTSNGNYIDNTDNDNNQVIGTKYANSSTEDYTEIDFLKYKSGNSIVSYRVVAPGGFLTFDKILENKIGDKTYGTYYCYNSYLVDSQSSSSDFKNYDIY